MAFWEENFGIQGSASIILDYFKRLQCFPDNTTWGRCVHKKKVDKEDGDKHLFNEHNDGVKTLLGYYYLFLLMYTFTETPK